MKIWLSQHVRAFSATAARLVRSPVATLFNISVMGVALALPLGFYVALSNIQPWAERHPTAPQLSLFLALDAGAKEVAHIEQALERHPGVRGYSYVPRDQALREMKATTGLADVIESLSHNPLPDTFVVAALDGTARSLEALRDEFARWPKVAHVQLDSAWAQKLEAALRFVRLVALGLGIILAIALIAVTFNTIRLQILTRREEIEIAKLIGATSPFIRRPFLYFGAIIGLAGGASAWLLVWGGVYLLNNGLAELSILYGSSFRLHPPTLEDTASLLAFSAWLGWLGARLSVGRHLAALECR